MRDFRIRLDSRIKTRRSFINTDARAMKVHQSQGEVMFKDSAALQLKKNIYAKRELSSTFYTTYLMVHFETRGFQFHRPRGAKCASKRANLIRRVRVIL